MDGPHSATIIAAVVGAVFGALLSAACTYYLAIRKHNRDARHRIVGQIGFLTDNFIAELVELHVAVRNDDASLLANKRAGTYRLQGAGGALEMEVSNFFRDRRTWATYHKLLERWETARKWMLDGGCKSQEELQLAIDWIYQQRAVALLHAARESQIPLTSPRRLKFLGFRFGEARRQYIRDLSFTDEAPPWEFSLTYEFRDKPFTPEEEKAAIDDHTAMVGELRCSIHKQAAHVRLHGYQSNFSVEIGACCEEFAQQVHNGLVHPEKRGRYPFSHD